MLIDRGFKKFSLVLTKDPILRLELMLGTMQDQAWCVAEGKIFFGTHRLQVPSHMTNPDIPDINFHIRNAQYTNCIIFCQSSPWWVFSWKQVGIIAFALADDPKDGEG